MKFTPVPNVSGDIGVEHGKLMAQAARNGGNMLSFRVDFAVCGVYLVGYQEEMEQMWFEAAEQFEELPNDNFHIHTMVSWFGLDKLGLLGDEDVRGELELRKGHLWYSLTQKDGVGCFHGSVTLATKEGDLVFMQAEVCPFPPSPFIKELAAHGSEAEALPLLVLATFLAGPMEVSLK